MIDQFLIIFSIWGFLFHRSLRCGYVVDDNDRYFKMQEYKKVKFHWHTARNKLDFLKGLANNCLYGAGMFKTQQQEHLFTSCIHLIITLLIYTMSGNLMASILWLINPINNQLSLWLNGRRYQIALLCILLAWNYKILAIFLYPFSVWLHVYGVAFPLLLLFTKYWMFTAVGIILFGIFGWRRAKSRFLSRKKDFTPGNEIHKVTPKKIIIYVKCLGYYFFNTLIPNKPRMYHEFLYYFGRYKKTIDEGYSLNFDFWRGLAVLTYILYEIFIGHNFWAFWWILFISQYSGIVWVTQLCSDRYMSLAGIGLMILFVERVSMLPLIGQVAVYGPVITLYIIRYMPLFNAYKNTQDFHDYHIAIQPDAVESRTLQAIRYLKMKDECRAFAVIKAGLRWRPNDFKLLIGIMQTMFVLEWYQRVLDTIPLILKNVPVGEEKEAQEELAKIEQDAIYLMNRKNMNRKQRRKAGLN